jgi:hypothetical protein
MQLGESECTYFAFVIVVLLKLNRPEEIEFDERQ